jgi:hypothetical protein
MPDLAYTVLSALATTLVFAIVSAIPYSSTSVSASTSLPA